MMPIHILCMFALVCFAFILFITVKIKIEKKLAQNGITLDAQQRNNVSRLTKRGVILFAVVVVFAVSAIFKEPDDWSVFAFQAGISLVVLEWTASIFVKLANDLCKEATQGEKP